MTTKNMLIIKDARGQLVAAHIEEPADSEVVAYITPAQEGDTVHRVSDVPAKIHNLAHPDEFHKAITDLLRSGTAKIAQTNAAELHAVFASRLKK